MRPDISHGLVILVEGQIFFFFAFFYLRRLMVGELYERYKNLGVLLPKSIAEKLSITSESLSHIKEFEPRERFVACLSSDWRNYQSFLEQYGATKAVNFLESFYSTIIDDLNKRIPTGDYYVTWTADELFVIFFDEHDDKDRIAENALRFSHSMLKKLPQKILRHLNYPLVYDIGLATGRGILGLQGPRKLKTTTVTGSVSEYARLLEYEAKMIRYFNDISNPLPIIAIDQMLFKTAKRNSEFPTNEFSILTPSGHSLPKEQYFFWQPSI